VSNDQRNNDKNIAFDKNRLDLTLADQKELSTLFFKVTIGYFAILYGVFSIYKILYDAHFGNANLLLFVILCFLSSSFCFWGSLSLAELVSVDLYVQRYKNSLDRTLMKSVYPFEKNSISDSEKNLSVEIEKIEKQIADIKEPYDEEIELFKTELEKLENEAASLKGRYDTFDKKLESFREISYYTNSHRLLMVLVTVILAISTMIFVYTLVKMPKNVLININLYYLKIPINCQSICIVYAIILLFILLILLFRDIKTIIEKTQKAQNLQKS
jgi:hypothetical protein